MVRDGRGLAYGPWHEHVRQWTANPYGADFMVVRYEDLLDDATRELRRFCEFAGIARDDALLHQVALGASFEIMQGKEATLGWEDESWPRDKPFVRRGEVGSFVDEMADELLVEFERQAAPMLRAWGYQPASDAVRTAR